MPETASTRTIVTFHPEVSCDVCERSLLRGEHADVFIDAGRQRTVCELCVPRASQAGWRRATGGVDGLELGEPRQRNGRGLLRRLRGSGRSERPERRASPAYESRAIDNVAAAAPAVPVPAFEPQAGDEAGEEVDSLEPFDSAPVVETDEQLDAADALERTPAELAAEVFNASEFPRRISGVAKSLGVPEVSIWSAEHHQAVVRILVAWELSWYRYEVDLTDEQPAARVIDQGSELSDLPREERLSNVFVDGTGRLVWTSV